MPYQRTTEEALGFTIVRTTNENTETHVRISLRGREVASVTKELAHWAANQDGFAWRESQINFPSRGAQTVANTLEHVGAIMLACSIGAQLDLEFPTGSIHAAAVGSIHAAAVA